MDKVKKALLKEWLMKRYERNRETRASVGALTLFDKFISGDTSETVFLDEEDAKLAMKKFKEMLEDVDLDKRHSTMTSLKKKEKREC